MADPERNMALEFLAMQLAANGRPGGPRWWCMAKRLRTRYLAAAEELIERWNLAELQAEARATEMGLNLPPKQPTILMPDDRGKQ